MRSKSYQPVRILMSLILWHVWKWKQDASELIFNMSLYKLLCSHPSIPRSLHGLLAHTCLISCCCFLNGHPHSKKISIYNHVSVSFVVSVNREPEFLSHGYSVSLSPCSESHSHLSNWKKNVNENTVLLCGASLSDVSIRAGSTVMSSPAIKSCGPIGPWLNSTVIIPHLLIF